MLTILGDIKQSPSVRKAPAFTDRHAAKYLQRGFKALTARDFDEAGSCASLVIKYMPKLAEAHFLVGLIAVEVPKWTVARHAFSTVVDIQDNHAAAWAQLARVYVMTGNYNSANEALAKSVTHGSDDPLVQDVVGNVYSFIGDQTEALKCFELACSKARNPSFVMNKAKCQMFLGKFEDAREAFDTVLKTQPQNSQAHWFLSRLAKATDESHIGEMLSLLKKLPENSSSATYLYYGLGKEYEDLEMWPEAFKAFEAGAKMRRTQVSYDEDAEIETFKALKSTYTKSWLEQMAVGCEDASPIFIMGQPRTGTTLIERIVTARDDVHSAGELQQFGMAVKRAGTVQGPGMISADNVRTSAGYDPKMLGNAYMESTRSLRSDSPRFVDKLPVNYLYAPLIAAALPNAKIVHVNRDPMDSCFASYKQFFAEAYFHSYDQGEMARHHLRYRDLMDHYREVLGDRMIDITYEDVVNDIETEARKLTGRLELDWQDASLDFHKQTGAVTTASATQVREKAHDRSVGRWREYENELTEMSGILKNN